MGVQRFQGDRWAVFGWLRRISLGIGNGVWSEVGQGGKNILHKEDRTSRHVKSQRV